MTLSSYGRITQTKSKVQGKDYYRLLIHIPSKIAKDSQFPFEPKQKVLIRVFPNTKHIEISTLKPGRPTTWE